MGFGRRKLYVALLAIGVMAGAPWAVTQAVWGDTQDVGANAFSTGNVDISTSVTTALVTFSSMAPGDKVTAPITVSNAGTLALRYAVSTAISGSTVLSGGLTLGIKSGVTTCSNAGFGTDGTSLYSGSLTSGAVGSASQGAQAGDRSLAASGTETLCFQVELPSSASNTLQSLTATATFTFASEQTANNA
ncbi:MAG: TasA family protein [Actinomycetota bacterium]